MISLRKRMVKKRSTGQIVGIIIVLLLITIPIAYYLISPAFEVVEKQEESPLVKDAMDSMSLEEKKQFDDAVNAMKDKTLESDEIMPTSPKVTAQGPFKERAHEVKGKALVINSGGKNILRFEDFETINGPKLHIYLSTDLGTGDFIDLGEIKATKGNVNYELGDDVDISKYNKVLVWCVPFRVLFSYAELN